LEEFINGDDLIIFEVVTEFTMMVSLQQAGENNCQERRPDFGGFAEYKDIKGVPHCSCDVR